jgi:hypothetical protein
MQSFIRSAKWLQERGYAIKDANLLFSPTPLGEALIGAYDRMGLKEVYECVAHRSVVSLPPVNISLPA